MQERYQGVVGLRDDSAVAHDQQEDEYLVLDGRLDPARVQDEQAADHGEEYHVLEEQPKAIEFCGQQAAPGKQKRDEADCQNRCHLDGGVSLFFQFAGKWGEAQHGARQDLHGIADDVAKRNDEHGQTPSQPICPLRKAKGPMQKRKPLYRRLRVPFGGPACRSDTPACCSDSKRLWRKRRK